MTRNRIIIVLLIFAILVILIVGILFLVGILPPFKSTHTSLNNLEPEPITTPSNGETAIKPYINGLEIPWGIIFVDNTTMLVTERPGRVRIAENGVLNPEPILSIDVDASGEAGLMSIVKHPDFSRNSFIYLYHTYPSSGGTKIKVARYKYNNKRLTFDRDIISNLQAASIHASGEMAFGPDGKIYILTGDLGEAELAQNTQSFAGKLLRLNDDGTIPNDNPFVSNSNYKGEIWTVGHRNGQGLAWHPQTKELFESEHGPSGFDGGMGMDEVNHIEKGENYGWPVIRGDETQAGYEAPLKQYSPAIAPGSAHFYNGNMFPDLKNKLLVATLRGETILVLTIENNKISNETKLVDSSYGRIRRVVEGPDGSIYFSTSNKDGRGDPRTGDDTIYRIAK